MQINGVTLSKGTRVSFPVLDADDANNPYFGTIVGADLDWAIARSYGDLPVAHARMTFAGETPDVETLNYFLLKLDTGVIIPVAAEWVDTANFANMANPPAPVSILVQDLPAANIPMVLSMIRALGYPCQVITTT